MTTSREVELGATLYAALDMNLVMSPQHFLAAAHCSQKVSAFGGCSWDTISSRRLNSSRAVGQGRNYIPSEWAVEKARGKQECLETIATSCRTMTGILQN